jgi:hypothetical protein
LRDLRDVRAGSPTASRMHLAVERERPYDSVMARFTEKEIERISSALAEPRRFKILEDLASVDTGAR